MYIDGKWFYCKSKTGIIIEAVIGLVLIIITFPFMAIYALHKPLGKLFDILGALDDRLCRKVAWFFG